MLIKVIYNLIFLPLSYLPHFVLYRIADVIYFFLAYILRYRKDIIDRNLKNSFPNKTHKERRKIRNKYYLHLSDLLVESVKNFTISKSSLDKRMTFENIDFMDNIYSQGKSVITMGGHYGNWERFAIAIGNRTKHEQYGIYKPIKNKFINKQMKLSRQRYGMQMISMLMTKKYFIKAPEILKTIVFGVDQWTSNPKAAYWAKFLNQDTTFFPAAENLARQFDWAVVYCSLVRTKRGYYHATYELITMNPKDEPVGAIMESFVNKLEATIKRNPPYWLWSHRRWKMTKREVFGNEV